VPDPFRVTVIRADERGVTHFHEVDVPLTDSGPIGSLSAPWRAREVVFRSVPQETDHDWHPAPARQLVVLLDGEIEIEVGDGATRRFRGGDVLLVEDTSGRGHRTRTIAGPRRSLFVTLDPAP
jgi:hypothetical protein